VRHPPGLPFFILSRVVAICNREELAMASELPSAVALSHDEMSGQAQERHRIAQGIHDDSLQAICAVGLGLANLKHTVQDRDTIDALARLQDTVRSAAQRLRSLLFELRPRELDDEGLVAALRVYLEHAQYEEGLGYTLDGELSSEPNPETREFLFSVTQELLMNVRKHAQASRVAVLLTARDGRHVIRVRDDGVGFDIAQALRARPDHLGLASLTERVAAAGGVLRIESTPGAGAEAEFEVPVPGSAVRW
jgi:signal transduction histidine kinase